MQITAREKKFLLAGGVFFALLLVYMGINYINENILSIDDKIKNSTNEERTLISHGNEFKKLRNLRSVEKIDLDPMIPQIEALLQKYGVRNNASLQPTESVIENKFIKKQVNIDFKEIDAASLLNIIKELENQSNIPYSIEFFQSTELGAKPGSYRVSLKVAAYKNKE